MLHINSKSKSLILNLSNMKINYLKLGIMALMIMAGTAIQAQTTSTTDAGLSQGAGAGVSVKLIDNKGTIKYLQANNGITSITSTSAGSATTTTWQLGGTLVSNTNITTGTQEFKLTLNDGTNQGTFVLDGMVQESGAAAGTVGGAGWTLLTRDETTGQIKKLLATDLVNGVYTTYTQSPDAASGATIDIAVAGLPALTATTTLAKLFVYRNGAKLRSGTDFTASAGKVTITQSADIPMYDGDIVEVQYIK